MYALWNIDIRLIKLPGKEAIKLWEKFDKQQIS